MKRFSGIVAALILLTTAAPAQTTNRSSEAELQGEALAQKILAQQPAENYTNTGVLYVRKSSRNHADIPIICRNFVSIVDGNTNIALPYWETIYQATLTNRMESLLVIHTPGQSNFYYFHTNGPSVAPILGDFSLSRRRFTNDEVFGPALLTPFAGSDFWLGDLGLEFFHWPQQKVLKKEVHRSRGCTVLESTNPDPGANGYSRVVSWIDNETLGIVEAYAYDANGRLLKDFYPKDFKKVEGQWQVQTLVMENDRTDSRSRLEFDLKNK